MSEGLTPASLMGLLWLLTKAGSFSSADCRPGLQANAPALHRAAQHGRGEHQEPVGDGRGTGSVHGQGPLLQGRTHPGARLTPRQGKYETIQAEVWGDKALGHLGGGHHRAAPDWKVTRDHGLAQGTWMVPSSLLPLPRALTYGGR